MGAFSQVFKGTISAKDVFVTAVSRPVCAVPIATVQNNTVCTHLCNLVQIDIGVGPARHIEGPSGHTPVSGKPRSGGQKTPPVPIVLPNASDQSAPHHDRGHHRVTLIFQGPRHAPMRTRQYPANASVHGGHDDDVRF